MARVAESRSVTLDGSGNGSVQLGPATSPSTWHITRLTTFGTSAVVPLLTVRRGSSGGPVVDTTRFGNADTSETSLDVFAGESIVAVYTGGSPGAVMSFYVEGVS